MHPSFRGGIIDEKIICTYFAYYYDFSISSPSLASRILTTPTADLLGSGWAELDYNYLRGQNSLEFNLGLHPWVNLGVRQYFGDSLVGTAKISLVTEGKD